MISVSKVLPRAAAVVALLSASGVGHALTFDFTFLGGTTAQAQQGFIDAGARWSTQFSDNATINLTVGQQLLATGVLAQTASATTQVAYSTYRAALVNDVTTANDAIAVAALPAASSFGLLINLTSDNPNGAGSAVPYVDNNSSANNNTIQLSNANGKALGLAVTPQVVGRCNTFCDGSVVVTTSFNWDFNPNDGVALGFFDFVGVATHEIGHALGFLSGVDLLDRVPGLASNAYTVAPLDLFRHSAQSFASGVTDLTVDSRSKYFSIDGGATAYRGATFSLGLRVDGAQPSHWRDRLRLGIMDPTADAAELLAITDNDKTAFDVIGWNQVVAVPEPHSWALYAAGLAAIRWRWRTRRRG